MITLEVQESINASVLCWLATATSDGIPNVSPKESFLYDGKGGIIIANIASTNSAENIEENNHVCVSFIDIFVQKGYKIEGIACILNKEDEGYDESFELLQRFTGSKFKINSVIKIAPQKVSEIVAPSYYAYPDRTEEDKIRESLITYRVEDQLKKAE